MAWEKVLLQRDIEYAIANTLSNLAAAHWLDVSYPTYKKYAQVYKDANGVSLFEKHKNPAGKGIPKRIIDVHRNRYPLEEILENRIPGYPLQKLRNRLLSLNVIEARCNICGFNEKRITDQRSPFLLSQKDGDVNNYKIENLELLCYNCYFMTVGNIVGKHRVRLFGEEQAIVRRYDDVDVSVPLTDDDIKNIETEINEIDKMNFDDQEETNT